MAQPEFEAHYTSPEVAGNTIFRLWPVSPETGASDGFLIKEDQMGKPVPEELAQDVQFENLRGRLFDHQVFQRSRGRFGFLTGLFMELAKQAKTPSEFAHLVDEVFADARTLGGIYYQLENSGQSAATGAFAHALADPIYRLPREEVVETDTKPYTLVMFDPEKTLATLEYLNTYSYSKDWSELIKMWREVRSAKLLGKTAMEAGWEKVNFPSAFEKLCQSLPTLPDLIPRLDMFYVNFPISLIGYAYATDVLSKFSTLESKHSSESTEGYVLHKVFHGCRGLTLNSETFFHCHFTFNGNLPSGLHFARWPAMNYLGNCVGFIYVVKGRQDEVKEVFPREFQDRLATWQLNIPANINTYFCSFGLHPAAEHEWWKKERPSFCSKNLTNNLGAIVLYKQENYAVNSLFGQPAPRYVFS